jgi:ribonuclease-3
MIRSHTREKIGSGREKVPSGPRLILMMAGRPTARQEDCGVDKPVPGVVLSTTTRWQTRRYSTMPQELTTSREAEILEECQKAIDYAFRQPDLLRSALTHASGANTRLASNERMEFLGDAVLGLVTCEQLYLRFPDYQEGDLTKIKSVVVSRRTCARFSKQLNLGAYLFLGKGMNHLHSATVPASLLADVYESLVAAIYLDGGLEAARTFILRHLGPEIEEVAEGAHGGNFKSLLQQVAQREFNATPQYILLDEKGPDHSKCFKIAAVIGRHTYAGAWGRNKKEAEQRAAMNALAQVNGDPVPFEHD